MDLQSIWGSGEHLLPLQMALRAFIMFLLALIMIRLGGMRMFGKKSALDYVIVIMLGALMARGVVGASPFWSTAVGGTTLVLTNWLLAYLSRISKRFASVVKGKPSLLYHNGHFDQRNMRKSNLCEEDVIESLRLETRQDKLFRIDKIFIENNGRLSFIEKEEKTTNT